MRRSFFLTLTACVVAMFVLSCYGNPFPAKGLCAEKRPVETGPAALDFFNGLLPLHLLKTSPGPYDWLANHEEPGQSFAQFVDSQPVTPDEAHPFLYLVKLGDFGPEQSRIIEQTSRFLESYFGLPVKFTEPLSLSRIPETAKRIHPQTGDKQVLSTYVIEQLLIPSRPADAFGLIAFTSADLWPGPGWNFVFGQASLPDRVGVWSIFRNGDPSQDEEAFRLCLKRTLKTGTHEVGHMLGMHHCVFFECNMNGSNHRQETDERPLFLCPVCLRKLSWAVLFDLTARFAALANLSEEFGMIEEKIYFKRVLQQRLQNGK